MKLSIKDFFSQCDQIPRKLRIWSYLLKKSLMENFLFCAEQSYHYLLITANAFDSFGIDRLVKGSLHSPIQRKVWCVF